MSTWNKVFVYFLGKYGCLKCYSKRHPHIIGIKDLIDNGDSKLNNDFDIFKIIS